MRRSILPGVAFAAVLVLSAADVRAHGGEDHGAAPHSPVVIPMAAETGFAAEGTGFQAVLATQPDGPTLVYLADADTNAPVAGATIEADTGAWQGAATATGGEGVYALAWAPQAQPVDVTLIVSAHGLDDLLLVQGVKLPPEPAPAAEPPGIAHWTHWTGGAGIGAVIALVAFMLARRRRAAAVAIAMALMAASGDALAHGGEDHGAPATAETAPQPGATLTLPKATQFLLGIRTTRIEPKEAADTVRVVGRVIPDPAGYARVQPSQPARVIADPAHPIPVPGQTVKRGQVLAVLEPTLSTLEKGDKRASLTRVDGEIALVEREMARQEALGGLVPAKQLETSRIRLAQLRKERGQITGTALGRELLVAPVDGVVTDVHVVPGEVVAPERALVEIVDPSRLRIEAVIHDLSAAQRISGATAASKLVPDRLFTLRLLGVSPKLDPQDQGVHAIFQVDLGEAQALRIGMPVDVHLATGATSLRTAVPRDAIAEMGGRAVVFVRTAPETFEARAVKVERAVGPLVEISDGLRPGDRVVTQGIEQIKAGR